MDPILSSQRSRAHGAARDNTSDTASLASSIRPASSVSTTRSQQGSAFSGYDAPSTTTSSSYKSGASRYTAPSSVTTATTTSATNTAASASSRAYSVYTTGPPGDPSGSPSEYSSSSRQSQLTSASTMRRNYRPRAFDDNLLAACITYLVRVRRLSSRDAVPLLASRPEFVEQSEDFLGMNDASFDLLRRQLRQNHPSTVRRVERGDVDARLQRVLAQLDSALEERNSYTSNKAPSRKVAKSSKIPRDPRSSK